MQSRTDAVSVESAGYGKHGTGRRKTVDGDNTWGITSEVNLEKCITDMVEYIESKQIPWGHVYGNHDAEGGNLAKKVQQKIYESFEYCVSMSGDENLSGVGNYVLPVYASQGDKVVFNVWALDSGSYLTGDGTAVDFRKACFGLIENGVNVLPYNTDDCDKPTPFYYLAEGETEWVEMSHGSDGCFGKAENFSVKDLKGWFAFPIENMLKRGTGAQLKEDSYITGVYLYYCLDSSAMAGQNFCIDDCAIAEDYTVFD